MSLKKKLKESLKKAGLNEGLAEIITVTKESEIAGIIEQLSGGTSASDDEPDISEVLASKAVSDFITENGFEKFLALNKTLQAESDKKVAKGLNTFKSKLLGTGEKTPEEIAAEEAAKGGSPNDGDMPQWAKDLNAKIDKMANARETESKSDLAKKALKAVNIPDNLKESWLTRMDLTSDVSFDDQAKTLAEEYKTIHTGIVGNESYEFQGGGDEGSKKKNGELSDSDIKDLEEMAKSL